MDPPESLCLGSSRGLLAMWNLDDELFLHRPLGGEQERMPPRPNGMVPPKEFWALTRYAIFGPVLHLLNEDVGEWVLAERFDLGTARTAEFDLHTVTTVYAAPQRRGVWGGEPPLVRCARACNLRGFLSFRRGFKDENPSACVTCPSVRGFV